MRARRRGLLIGLLLGLLLSIPLPGVSQTVPETLRRLQADILHRTGEGQYAEALQQAEALLALLSQARGPQDPGVAQVLSATAMLAWLQGDRQRGEQLYRQALQILETALGPNDRALVPLLLSWGMMARDHGLFREAQPLLQRALALCTVSPREDTSDTMTVLTTLAGVHEGLGDYIRAEQALRQALQLVSPAQQETDLRLAPVLHGLGRIAHARGNWVPAATLLHRALRLYAHHQAEHDGQAPVLIDLAILAQDQQDYVQAEALLQHARRLQQRWGEHSVFVAPALYGLARLALAKGDYAGALTLLVDNLSIMERAYGKDSPKVAHAVLGLGVVWTAEAHYAAAIGAYQRVLTLWEHTLGQEHPSVAYVLYNLATLYEQQGQATEAEPLYLRAMHIWQRVLGEAHPLVAGVMSRLGALAETHHDLEQAQQWFASALAVWQQTSGTAASDSAIALNGLARLHARRGELPQAIARVDQANDLLERTLYRNLRSGSEQQRALYVTSQLVGTTHRTLSLHLQTAPQHADAARLALRTVLRRKGILLEAQITGQQLLWRQLDAEGRKLLTDLKQFRELRTRLALMAGDAQRIEVEDVPLAATLDDIIADQEQALASKTASAQEETPLPTLPAVAQHLPQDTCLVEFVAYIPLLFSSTSQEVREAPLPPRRYAAYVLHKDGTLHWADLGEARVIDAAVSTLRRALQNPRQHAWQPASQALYRHIIYPLEPWLSHVTHLLLSPDGELHLVPFAALRDAQGTLLLERYRLTYLTTGRDLLHTSPPQPDPGPPVIFAGPDFDALLATAPAPEAPRSPPVISGDTPQRATVLPSFTPLPGAAREGQVLQQSLPQAVLIRGVEATEARLKAVQRPRLLHLATHGFFLPYQQPVPPAREDLLLASDPTTPRGLSITPAVVQAAVAGSVAANPLLRAGLALAGANHPQADHEDGILTALEATTLDLRGTRLVVLSACETGVGDIRDGESVYGLRRAFTIAGAESQMTTLWKVSDHVTQQLMVAYYQRLMAGAGRSEALRQVQLELAHSPHASHPFYWAAFLLSGSWEPL